MAHIQAKSLEAIIDPSYLTRSEKENIARTSASLLNKARALVAQAEVSGLAFSSEQVDPQTAIKLQLYGRVKAELKAGNLKGVENWIRSDPRLGKVDLITELVARAKYPELKDGVEGTPITAVEAEKEPW